MKRFTPLLFAIVLVGCQGQDRTGQEESIESNPAANGFNTEGSDSRAIQIADKVMTAMGGRENWDKAHFICWDFFGSRSLIWDKYSGQVRIDSHRDSSIYIVNINTLKGRVFRQGEEITNPDSLAKYLDRGKRIWINDSYWLVMPFKLKDSGVTLTWIREDTTMSGIQSDVLQLQFQGVGVTPENRYEVWVDKNSHLVRQWAYYRNQSQEKPGFVLPWNDWESHGDILLSGNRGERSLENIMVLESVPSHTFDSFEKVSVKEQE